MSGDLFIISAPSGAGKTTLIGGLMERLAPHGKPVFSVSHTTRPPRRGEHDGQQYHFVDPPTFERLIGEDAFLEWAWVHGNLYGTARGEVAPRLARGEDVLLDIDVQGAEQVLARCPEAVSIFIMPPSADTLAMRLRGRGSDCEETIAQRLANAQVEVQKYGSYQYVIVNDDAALAADVLAAIVLAERHRTRRMEPRAASIFATASHRVPRDRDR